MTQNVNLLIGTKKGVFLLDSDTGRDLWSLRGPFCEAWPINHVIANPATGVIHAGGGNEWFGPAVWKSSNGGDTWTHSSEGLAYAAGEQPIKAVWSLARGHGCLYAGVEPAGLFRSDDGGQTWRHIAGMRDRLCDSTPAIRRHINIFVDGERVSLDTQLATGGEVYFLTAMSGG